ncbi:MAG: hypothetical protein M1819_006978 [Sarea resinae]|nr:MAG: hypothetical protein M1819_006978 [Sarea resinae]
MAEPPENPLLAALPPATDYLTYLTLLEYNLTPDLLPTLHDVLQNQELTTNIGWDLVHLLLPLLPASDQCLQDVAKLGNPREVVLKVTEALRELDVDAAPTPASEDQLDKKTSALPQPILQFTTLVSLLSILHSRIKTKYPSRFLSTSLQAVLKAYTEIPTQETTSAVLQFVKDISGHKRPSLPPRLSNRDIPAASLESSAPDPEAAPEAPSAEESALQNRLLQSFVTHVLEDYVLSFGSDEDYPGLAWTSRLQERAHPEKMVPGKVEYGIKFTQDESLKAREVMVGQIRSLAREVDVDAEELLRTVKQPEIESLAPSEEDDPPLSVEEIPLSKIGATFLLCAQKVAGSLFDSEAPAPTVSIFPDHALIVKNLIGVEAGGGMSSAGTEPLAVIDAVLALGIMALNDGRIGQPIDDEEFTQYLQTLSLLAANTPSSALRYHAYTLTSEILHSHPSDVVRLAFIRDTLEHCPYENLKACAVTWTKDEILAANKNGPITSNPQTDPSVFATPVALDTLAPFLFPALDAEYSLSGDNSSKDNDASPLSGQWGTFKAQLSLYLTTLNFYYLVLASRPLHAALGVPHLHARHDVAGTYLAPLRQASSRFRAALRPTEGDGGGGGSLVGEEGGESGAAMAAAELDLLDDVLARIGGVEW